MFAALLGVVVTTGCGRPVRDMKKSDTRLDLAKDFLRKGQLEAADTEAKKALDFHAGNADAHYVLGLVDLLRSRANHQLLEIDQCLTGVDAEALAAEKDRFLTASDKHFSDACKLDSELGEAWANRGITATLLGRYDDAISHLQHALGYPARLRNIALVRANLGWAFFHKGDFVAAAKELLQAVQFQPGMCVATYRLGRVYFARKEWEKALQKFREVTGPLKCPIQDAHLYMMKTYLELGAVDELSGARTACVQMAPQSCIALKCQTVSPSAGAAGSVSGTGGAGAR